MLSYMACLEHCNIAGIGGGTFTNPSAAGNGPTGNDDNERPDQPLNDRVVQFV
jgi:hypothetical protein